MKYTNMDISDLRGSLLADLLIAIDADFEVRAEGRVIYEEPAFPVVELARSLAVWAATEDHDDFIFESLTADEPGIVMIRREGGGWVVSSAFTPEVVSAVADWVDVSACIAEFIGRVTAELRQRGVDADRIFRS